MTFKVLPGEIFTGHVETTLQAVSTEQVQPSDSAITPQAIEAAPFVVRVKLDDAGVSRRLPAGSTGEAGEAFAIKRLVGAP